MRTHVPYRPAVRESITENIPSKRAEVEKSAPILGQSAKGDGGVESQAVPTAAVTEVAPEEKETAARTDGPGPVQKRKRPGQAKRKTLRLRQEKARSEAALGAEERSTKKEEKKIEPHSMEPPSGGYSELSPLLSKMLEVELEDVLKKVWALEPENPTDAAERFVVKRYQNQAGEALRKVLGLNITKRLLNVHNPLYVKMAFTGKPLRADLVAFLRRYNVTAFKRVGERGGTFAAKMTTFQDFDDLCTNKNLKCGKINVTVTPCYQFLTCPPNLRTSYGDIKANNTRDPASKTQHTTEVTKRPERAETTSQQTPKVLPTKPNQVINTTQSNITTKVTPKTPIQTEPAKDAPKATPTKVENKPAEAKPTNNTASKVTNVVQKAATTPQTSVAKVAATVKQNQNTTKPETLAVTNQNVATTNTPKVSQNVANQTQNTTTAAPKTTPVKPTQTSQSVAKTTPTQTPQNTQNNKATPTQPSTKVTQNTQTTNPAKTTTINTTPNTQSAAKTIAQKPVTQNAPTTTPTKVTAQNQKPPVPTTATQAQKTVTATKAATTAAKPATTGAKPATTAAKPATAATKPAVTATKSAPTATKPAVTATKSAPTATKPAVAAMKPAVTATKPAAKLATPNKTKVAAKLVGIKPKPGAKTKVSPKKKSSDFDELSDHDILALISEGIVLDECSGSDAE